MATGTDCKVIFKSCQQSVNIDWQITRFKQVTLTINRPKPLNSCLTYAKHSMLILLQLSTNFHKHPSRRESTCKSVCTMDIDISKMCHHLVAYNHVFHQKTLIRHPVNAQDVTTFAVYWMRFKVSR